MTLKQNVTAANEKNLHLRQNLVSESQRRLLFVVFVVFM